MAIALLATITAAVFAVLPNVLSAAAPASVTRAESTAAVSPYGIWPDSIVPKVPSSKDAKRVSLGLVFSSATAGRLRGVQYYAAGANRLATTGGVWNAAGRRIASITFPKTRRNGWKTAKLSAPTKIRAGAKYTVSYRAPKGRYAVKANVFSKGRTLTANSLTAHRGTFTYGTGRPTRTRRGSHYFIDVLFAPSRSKPTPTPTPSPTGYPNASNTGVPAGTTLTTVNGNVALNTAGQVYADKQVNGCITVNAPNVTIRRVRVVCEGSAAIYSYSTELLVEDTEIDCGSDGVGRTGLASRNYTARRVNAHGCENIMWAEENVLVVDSYLHDPVPYEQARDPHTDSVQIPSGATNIVLRHNQILGGYIDQSNFGNAAITMGGNVSGIVVDDNVLAGGGYTLYCEQENLGGDGSPQPQYTNNRFSTVYRSTVGGFGLGYDCADDIQSGNVMHETGAAISLH